MSVYISFIRGEDCGFVHNSMARRRQSRSEELYLSVWTESELALTSSFILDQGHLSSLLVGCLLKLI